MVHATKRLKAFRKRHGLSMRDAAHALSVEHTAYLAWESGKQTPLAPYRSAIAIWTRGEVTEDMWPTSERERHAESALANVKPFTPSGG